MRNNVGSVDRTFRIVLGVLLLMLLFIDGNARWLGLIGFLPLATGFVGSCPLYSVFGFNSHPKPQAKM